MDDMGLYDSDTNASLSAERVVDLPDDEDGSKRHLFFCRAKRGQIVQIRTGSLRTHYFVAESMLDEDADRIGRWLSMDGKEAVAMIRREARADVQ